MSFEIIIKRNTEINQDWDKEPELVFINEDRNVSIKSTEKFEEKCPKKDFYLLKLRLLKVFKILIYINIIIFNI